MSEHWHTMDEWPEPGRRIIAVFNDGSGADLYFTLDDGLIDSDGDEVEMSEDYAYWAYLPDGIKLWCEVRSVDPFEFPESNTP